MGEIQSSAPESVAPTNEQMANRAQLLRDASNAVAGPLRVDYRDSDTHGVSLDADEDLLLDRQIPGPFDFGNDLKLTLVSEDVQEAYGCNKEQLVGWLRVELREAALDESMGERWSLMEEARITSYAHTLDLVEAEIREGVKSAKPFAQARDVRLEIDKLKNADERAELVEIRERAERLEQQAYNAWNEEMNESPIDWANPDWSSPQSYKLKSVDGNV